MDYGKIRGALQDLIIRFQDAEKGFKAISKKTKNITLKGWVDKFARERHEMHQTLERHMFKLGGDPEVKTSFLGDIHRMFIHFKLDYIDNDIPSAVQEIERGSTTLMSDIDKVLKEVEMPSSIVSILSKQKSTIKAELAHLNDLKRVYEAAGVS